MTTEKIRQETERMKTLLSLQKDLYNSSKNANGAELEKIRLKICVAKEELLKCTYKIGKLLKELEEKV